MKKLLIVLIASILVGCGQGTTSKDSNNMEYDFEALRDSLHLDSSCVFVKEMSPLYEDDNPYDIDYHDRLKTLYYKIISEDGQLDTIVFGIHRDNEITFQGRSLPNFSVQGMIDWMIKNREQF